MAWLHRSCFILVIYLLLSSLVSGTNADKNVLREYIGSQA